MAGCRVRKMYLPLVPERLLGKERLYLEPHLNEPLEEGRVRGLFAQGAEGGGGRGEEEGRPSH